MTGLMVCMFLLVVFSSLLLMMNQHICWQEERTMECTVTIASVEVRQTASSVYVNIHTEQPQRHLYILSAVSGRVDIAPIKALKPGDVITCRVLKSEAGRVDLSMPIEIGAMTIGDNVIFTLAERNAAMKHSAQPTNTAAYILLCGLACTAAICGAALCRRRVNSRAAAD